MHHILSPKPGPRPPAGCGGAAWCLGTTFLSQNVKPAVTAGNTPQVLKACWDGEEGTAGSRWGPWEGQGSTQIIQLLKWAKSSISKDESEEAERILPDALHLACQNDNKKDISYT